MTQEDKDLLLKDICSRLPYGVKVQDTYYNSFEPAPIWLLNLNTQEVRLFADECYQSIEYIKPYLFPMSSMTDEQKKEYNYITERWMYDSSYSISDSVDWLNAHHFDYRGLIPMGLANDATGLNIY